MNKAIRTIGLILFLILIFGIKSNVVAASPDTLTEASIGYEYAFEEAIKQYNIGNYSQALSLFKKCLEVNNRSSAAHYQIANIYLMAGDSKAALEFARAAYLLDSSNKWISLLLIKCYQLVDRNDSAIFILQRLLSTNDDDLNLMYEYGSLLSNTGKYDKAIACFNAIDLRIGLNEGTSLARQQIYMQKHEIDSATKELMSLIKAFPSEMKYLGMLAELYSSIHANSKAKEIYKRIFQNDSTNSLALISIADFYRDIKEYDNAIFQMNKVLNNPDIQLESKLGLVIGYIRNDSDLLSNLTFVKKSIEKLELLYPGNSQVDKLLVDFFIRTNNYDSAIVVIDRFISSETSKEIWQQYFFLMNARNMHKKIIQNFGEAKIHAADMVGIYIITGIANMQMDNYREAINVLSEGMIVQNISKMEKIEILKYEGEAFFKLKEMHLSDSCFDEVLQLDPLNYLVLNNYSFYLALRDTELYKAKLMSGKVVKRFPENSTYIDTYAFILMKLKKFNAAYKWMKKAVILNKSEDPEIYEHMGDILFFKGKKQEAIIFWKKAKEKGRSDINIDEKPKLLIK